MRNPAHRQCRSATAMLNRRLCPRLTIAPSTCKPSRWRISAGNFVSAIAAAIAAKHIAAIPSEIWLKRRAESNRRFRLGAGTDREKRCRGTPRLRVTPAARSCALAWKLQLRQQLASQAVPYLGARNSPGRRYAIAAVPPCARPAIGAPNGRSSNWRNASAVFFVISTAPKRACAWIRRIFPMSTTTTAKGA